MSDYLGTDTMIALQRQLRERQPEFDRNPLIANGGRIMNILDPDRFGWDRVQDMAIQDRCVALSMVERDATLQVLKGMFSGTAEYPFWEVFTGSHHDVLRASNSVLAQHKLQPGWRVESDQNPTDMVIKEAQTLSMSVGVAPAPAYYMRGETLPAILTCIYDDQGKMIACASGNMRYHPQSDYAGWIFAGGICVDEDYRGLGLGSIVTAALLRDSQSAFGWSYSIAQARIDNLASVGMIRKCGLAQDPGKATIIINLTGDIVTR